MLLLLLACTDNTGDSKSETGDSAASTQTGSLTLTPTDCPAVFRAEWVTDEPATGRLVYSTDTSYDHTLVATDSEDGLTHTALMAGLAAGETWNIRAISTIGEADEVSGEAVQVIEPPPDRIVAASVEDNNESRGGFNLVTVPSPGDNITAILDRKGRPVWWTENDYAGTVLDAHMSQDGLSVDLLVSDTDDHFMRVGLDGTIQLDVEGLQAHHGFATLPEGGYLAMVHDTREVDGIIVVGDMLVELGTEFQLVRTLWNAFDDMPLTLPTSGSGDEGYDWSHANDVTYDASTGKVLVSLYGLDTVVQIDFATGALEWQLGGENSTFALSDDEKFIEQHGVRPFDGGVIIFDNGGIPDSGVLDAESAVSTYTMVEGVAKRTRRFAADDSIYIATLGNADPDEDGLITVGWGVGGRLTELEPSPDDFTEVYRLDMPLGSPFGYVHRVAVLAGATF